ncbi:tRNA lysidine(34) synthetase TilS [Anaerotignum sp.]|uniref:tRNA lysidine(34) synthetase TilS n=1 Tax=Anaerotignum sp. TaxID=2039241 RepID=UPI0028A81F78|nr:tRNA lysidine(34) synthetase TilS [Anaerotignum sp.]
MKNKVWQTIEKFQMCPYGTKIIVGVSGGADSIALLHILKEFSLGQNWSLTAVHVHHGLRAVEADRDRDFVEKICREWEIPCKVYCFDVAKEAETRGMGTEEAGRLLRYESFQKESEGGIIAVAHNQNDQGETVLMRLCRGAGGAGLIGIRPVRDNIVRPLLFCTRKEIESYCEENQLSYCQDSTNFESVYTRNRIRNQILPLLEEIYPKTTEHIAQTAEILGEEQEYLQMQTQDLFFRSAKKVGKSEISLNVEVLQSAHTVLRKRVFAAALEKLGVKRDVGAIHFEKLNDLLDQESGKSINLPNKVIAKKNYDFLQIKKAHHGGKDFCYPLNVGEEIFVPEAGIFVNLKVCTEKKAENDNDGCTKVFDYDKIGCTLFCRTRQKGDSLAIRNGRKKLKDFMIDEKIPREERDSLPLIALDSDILWVVGKRISVAYQPDEATKRYLTVQIRRFI